MYSLTHSCMHSLASLAIFAFPGRASFMIRVTGTKLPVLASNFADDSLELFLADEEPSRTLPLFTVTSSRDVCTSRHFRARCLASGLFITERLPRPASSPSFSHEPAWRNSARREGGKETRTGAGSGLDRDQKRRAYMMGRSTRWGTGLPLAIGNQRSCSLTSNS